MVDPQLEHQRLGMSGRTLAVVLIVKYFVLTTYGVWAAVEEVPSFVTVGGSFFAVSWAAIVAIAASAAMAGVLRTWLTGRFRLEKWTTGILVLTFIAYSIVLIIRAISTDDWGSAPLALLPLALVGFPTVRYYSLLEPREEK